MNLFADEMADTSNIELSKFDQWLNWNKFKLNANKTKVMVLGHKNIKEVKELKIGNATINRVKEMKHLGSIIDELWLCLQKTGEKN